MSDPTPSPAAGSEDKRSLMQKIVEFLHPGPDSREELYNTLSQAEQNQVIAPDSRAMLEGVIRISQMTVTDVMVPSKRMDLLDIDSEYDALLASVIETGHSRFPVYDGEKANIVGVLMAKDLLKLQRAPELNIRALLRPPVFVPESKALNDLLREFRAKRNHLAIVIDEFGRVAGLITIEDVLEEIVGEIEDEFDDDDEDEGDIYNLVDGSYRISGDTPIERLDEYFDVKLAPEDTEDENAFDTIGGLVAHELGHVPRRGEVITLQGLNFMALHTQAGAVRWFKVTPAVKTE
ncbi:HlyC/CorC family transporter [Brachymonas sp.]|uniref:HlyC/CorC family transporter n=1 Tax=Brachymonas sp. TaxID=1936292 RepID=UPI0035B09BC5